jgi:energy-coupling factor transport system permease protein
MHGPSVSISHVRGTSWLHRLDPVAKFAWVLPFGFFCFTTYWALPLFISLLIALAIASTGQIMKPLAKIMLVFTPISASIIVIQSIAPAVCLPNCMPPVHLGPINIYNEGLSHAITLLLRVSAFQVIAFTLLLTTHPSDLFASLARMKVPYLANFMISMTLQLIPVLQREVQLVLAAQRSRGMKGSGFGSIVPSFVPVAAGAVERVQQLAISLESRAFGSKGNKTSYRRVPSGPFDIFIGIVGVVVMTFAFVYGLFNWGQAGGVVLIFPPMIATAIFVMGAVVFVGVFVVAFRVMASA